MEKIVLTCSIVMLAHLTIKEMKKHCSNANGYQPTNLSENDYPLRFAPQFGQKVEV